MSKPKKRKKNPTRILVYKGVFVGKGDRLFHVYYPITQEQFDSGKLEPGTVLSSKSMWFSKRFNYARPGTILSIEHDKKDEGAVFANTAKTMDYMDDAVCAEWSAESKAIESANRMVKRTKREGRRDLSLECLEPLRAAYWKLRTRDERTIFMARVNTALTSAKPLA